MFSGIGCAVLQSWFGGLVATWMAGIFYYENIKHPLPPLTAWWLDHCTWSLLPFLVVCVSVLCVKSGEVRRSIFLGASFHFTVCYLIIPMIVLPMPLVGSVSVNGRTISGAELLVRSMMNRYQAEKERAVTREASMDGGSAK